jgi:PKD repeat protein
MSGPGTYTWDFGDGQTGEGARVTHAYDKAGNYRARLTVNDGKNTECSVGSGAVAVSVADRASVSVKGTESACLGRTTSFEANGTGGSLKYKWDFGDGETWEGGGHASHKYAKAGSYTVTVTADNGQGTACSTAISSTSVKISEPPVADAGENLACCVGKEVSFNGTKSTGTGLSYHWDFGDGATADTAMASHAYEKPGNYRVVLTVKDDSNGECSMSTDSFVANVNTKPEAVIEVR